MVQHYQTVKLGHRAFGDGLADIPHLDTALATSVHVFGWVADSNSAHHLAMTQCVDLSCVSRNPWTNEGICWEWHRLQLSLSIHVK
jgi:hypothetical protein